MAEIIYPNNIKMNGPWLIDSSQLMELDSIIEEEWKSLTQLHERVFNGAFEERLKDYNEEQREKYRDTIKKTLESSNYFTKKSKKIYTTLKSGNKLSSSSIKEAIGERSIQNEIVTSIEIDIRCLEIYAKLTVEESWGNKLKLSVDPPANPAASDLFIKLDRWVNTVRPKKWLSFWRILAGFSWPICLFILLFSVMILPENHDGYKKQLKSEAYELLENGINKNETEKALSILLSLETEYTPKKWSTDYNIFTKKYLVFVVSVVLVSIILSIFPRIHIGITRKSDDRIKLWRFWTNSIAIVIPGLIFTGIILPFIYDNLKILF